MILTRPALSGSIHPVTGSPFGPGPDTLANLEIWFDAYQLGGLSNNDPISTLTDFSGNSRNGTGILANISKPVYKSADGPNSRPAIRLAGNSPGQNGWFTLPDFLTGYTSGDGFVIVKLDFDPSLGADSAAPPFGDWGTAGDGYFPFNVDGVIYSDFGSTVRETTVNPADSLTSWRTYEERSASGAWSNHLDGTQLFTTATNTVAWSTTPYVAHSVTNTKYLLGEIAEQFFYSRILDDTTERKAVINVYLNTKYGFSLPT